MLTDKGAKTAKKIYKKKFNRVLKKLADLEMAVRQTLMDIARDHIDYNDDDGEDIW